MDPDRRHFLVSGLAVGFGGILSAGRLRADDIDDEVRRRSRYLSPPDGTPADSKFGVPFDSPCAKPFQDRLFIPAIAKPEINMTGREWQKPDGSALGNQDWWDKFLTCFQQKAEEYRKRGITIGAPPVPQAHQRFWEFRPKKFYILREREVRRQYHRDYGKEPNAWTWCYEALCEGEKGGSYQATSPGPTIHARYGEPILVRRVNDLPEAGHQPGSARVTFGLPSTTTHLHNAHTASESDGNPDDFINPGEYWDHHYANFPSGFDSSEKLTTLWYHDHRMDYTAANVYAGLDGFYLLFDERVDGSGQALPPEEMQDVGSEDETEGWRLPYGKGSEFDIPLILHDLLFRRDDAGAPQLVFDGYNSDGVLGDQFTVNRVIRPYHPVKRRKYRFRILNGGPSRFYELSLHTRTDGDHRKDTPKPQPFVVITGDGNIQPNPLAADSVHLGVAQRVDVILDFSGYQDGDRVYLVNRLRQIKGQGATGELIPVPSPDDDPARVNEFFDNYSVMRFDVGGPEVEDPSRIPLTFRPLPRVDLTEVVRERVWRFDHDGGLWTVNGRVFDGNRIDAGIEEGTAEIWTIRNEGNGWQHPIHSHFTEFITLEIDGRPQYQLDVQTGLIVHKGESYRRTLIDIRHLREQLNKRLSRAAPLKGLDQKLLKKVEGHAKMDLDPKRAAAFQGDQLNRAVDSIAKGLMKVQFDTVAEFLAQARSIRDYIGVYPNVGRFIGGPRRDIALLFPGTEMKVFMRWRDFRGKYVMHCHNVVHEDHAMMVRWDITPRGEGFDTPKRVRPGPGQPREPLFAEPHPGQTSESKGTIR